MGLDICAYRRLTIDPLAKLDIDGNPTEWETCWCPGPSMEWSESVWPGRGEGIDARTVYRWAEEFRFRAGSYSGYGVWRDELRRFAGSGAAFHELIDFADNEGTIGPVVSAKLLRDFAENLDRARIFHGDDDPWFFQLYLLWKRAFEMAADGGAVDFR